MALQVMWAWEATGYRKIAKAEKHIHRMDSLIDKYNLRTPEDFQIKRGYILWCAKRYTEAKLAFDSAWAAIEANKRLSAPDKLYMKSYIFGPAKISLDVLRYWNPHTPGYLHVKPVAVETIDLNAVSRWVKRDFPMRDHPQWEGDVH